MIDPMLVKKTIDMMRQNPGVEVEDSPPGLVDAVLAEQDRQLQNSTLQTAMDNPDPTYGLNPEKKLPNPLAPDQPVGAAAQGALQGVSLGFSDEIEGLAGGAGEMVSNLGSNTPSSVWKAYTGPRDEARARQDLAASTQPVPNLIGGLVGGAALGKAMPTMPVPNMLQPAAPFVRGAEVGGLAGIGMNKNISDLPEDVGTGALVGGALSTAGEALGQGIQKAGRWLNGKADVLLQKALGMTSDEIIALKQVAAQNPNKGQQIESMLDEVLMVTKNNADSPISSPQTIRENIVKPDIGAPTKFLNTAEDMAQTKLGQVADKKTGGLPPASFLNAIAQAGLSRGELMGGLGFSSIAQGMRNALGLSDAAAGMSQVGTDKLMKLIDIVEKSDDPALEDYLAQEADPSYRALRMEVDNERREAASKQ